MLIKYSIKITFLLLIVLNGVFCVVYLRPKNERGPNAWNSGVKCLKKIKKVYFVNPMETRVNNIVLLHTKNMTSPAYEIEKEFLIYMNNFVVRKDDNDLQIRVISDTMSVKGISVITNGVTLTDFYLLVADDYDKLISNVLNYVSLAAAWNPLAKFLVLYNNPNDRVNANEFSKKLFYTMFNSFHVTKIVLAYATGTTKYELYVNDPYASKVRCTSSSSLKIGVFDKGHFENANFTIEMIQTKTNNPPSKLNNCQFNLCAKISPPFIEVGCKDGLEMLILDILQRAMEFQVNISCTDMNRGELLPNGSFTDLLDNIKKGKCDLIVGGFFPDNEVHDAFGVTTAYLQDSYAWYVQFAPLRPLWKGLFVIFQPMTWLVFALIMCISGFAWFIFGFWLPETANHKKIICCFLNTWAVFLGVSSNDRPEYTTLRIFFIALALYSLNTTTIYTSKLISVFTEPMREHQLNTVEEIIMSGLKFGGLPEFRDWFNNDDAEDKYIYDNYNTSSTFETSIENIEYVEMGKQGILLSRLFVQYNGLNDDVYGFKDNVFSNQLEMIADRSLSILPKINNIIIKMKDFGLMSKIYHDFIYKNTIVTLIKETVEKMNENLIKREDIVLTVNHLQSAFGVLAYGLMLSLIVFFIELAQIKIRNAIKRRFKKIF